MKLDALYAESEQYGERMRQKDMEAEKIRTQTGELDAKAKEQESAIAVLESTIRHHRENIERARQELEETDSRAGGLSRRRRNRRRASPRLSWKRSPFGPRSLV